MELQKVSIKDFKGIEYKEMEFKPVINIIKGENGTGKTSIMEALATLLSQNIQNVYEKSDTEIGRNLTKSDYRCAYQKLGDGGYNKVYMKPLEIKGEIIIDGNCNRIGIWSEIDLSIKEISHKLGKGLRDAANTNDQILPILNYEGIPRINSDSLLAGKKGFDTSLYCRREGYRYSMKPAINTKFIINWCTRMEQIAWQEEKKISEYEAAKMAVECIECSS